MLSPWNRCAGQSLQCIAFLNFTACPKARFQWLQWISRLFKVGRSAGRRREYEFWKAAWWYWSKFEVLKDKGHDGHVPADWWADRIFVYGSGNAQKICARDLQRMFIPRHRYLILIEDTNEFNLMRGDFKVNDLFIIISLSGETPELIPQARMLSAKGIPFISITNLKNNVLAQLTPHNLYATSKPVTLSDKTEIVAFAPFFSRWRSIVPRICWLQRGRKKWQWVAGGSGMMQKIQRFGSAMFVPVLLFAFAGIIVGISTLFKK